MKENEFIEELEKIGIELSEDKLKKLKRYYYLLVEWNKKINLTSIVEEKDVYLKHFYDCLTLIKAYDLKNTIKLCDVGTGAGFPGLVLKICFDNLDITLVDSTKKRISFLELVIDELKLKNIRAYHSRVEEFALNHREEYDVVTSRAVAKLNILSELCIPMVKINGYFLPMKANLDNEVINSEKCMSLLNSKIEDIISFKLPFENSNRNILKIQKINACDTKYPRKFDKIKKNPL